jgi:hypothetical protein
MAILSITRIGTPVRGGSGVRRGLGSGAVVPAPRAPLAPGVRPAGGRHRADRQRPARLVAAPDRGPAVGCAEPRRLGSTGWLVLVGALTFLIVLVVGWISLAAPSSAPAPVPSAVVTVHPGQTLWDVARQVAPNGQADQVVGKLRQLNGLVDNSVYPGEVLAVPSTVR